METSMSFLFYYREKNPIEFSAERFISAYEKSYFLRENDNYFIPGISINSCFVEKQIQSILDNGISSENDVYFLFAWKIGGINHKDSQKNKVIQYKDSWDKGATVEERYFKSSRDNFSSFCKDICQLSLDYKSIKSWDDSTMLTVVDEVEKAAEKYKVSLGPVYILTIIYFITRGESPIFDRFAYSAVKSLYYSKLRHADFTPEDVWYECPSGKKPKDILKVINDYKWYLEQVFGKSNIARDIDRSLWVYGHPKVISCKKPNNL